MFSLVFFYVLLDPLVEFDTVTNYFSKVMLSELLSY